MKTRYWVGGCLSAIILLAVIAGATYYFLLQASDELVETYTSPEPRDFSRAETDTETVREEALTVIERFRDFIIALETGEDTGSFSMSADDINALLEQEDLFKEIHGMARVDIQDDKLQAEISVPLGMFNDRFEGKFLNGTGELAIEMKDDRLEVTIDRLEVGGRDIPAEFMNEIRKNNLLETLYREPALDRFLHMVKDVKIEDGRLVIQPR
ncbi:MAG: hypothetical protein OXD39_04740 [Gemmatimonadetes bacterium]|nr:hypothetical protein [Gemmatimonadota bacterium]